MRQIRPETGESLAISKRTNKALSVVLFIYLSVSLKMENISVGSVELRTHFHDNVDDHSKLASKTESNKSVVKKPSKRNKG